MRWHLSNISCLISSCLSLGPVIQLPSQNPSIGIPTQNINASTPGKWPAILPSRIDIPVPYGPSVYLVINSYGRDEGRVDPRCKTTVIADLALIAHELEDDGEPEDVLLSTGYREGMVSFKYMPLVVLGTWGLRRRELSMVLEEIGGLTLLDGTRRIRSSYVMREGREVGKLSIGVQPSRDPAMWRYCQE